MSGREDSVRKGEGNWVSQQPGRLCAAWKDNGLRAPGQPVGRPALRAKSNSDKKKKAKQERVKTKKKQSYSFGLMDAAGTKGLSPNVKHLPHSFDVPQKIL